MINLSNLFYNGWKYALVNLLTLSRILLCPVLLILLLTSDHLPAVQPLTPYLLLAAFLTDALDGFLARKLKVTSEQGTRLDSIADDCLFVTAAVFAIVQHNPVIFANITALVFLGVQHVIKMALLWKMHRKFVCGMHTYLTKFAAFLQAVFFLHSQFFLPNSVLFFLAVSVTSAAIGEEILLIITQKELKTNYKGLFFKKDFPEKQPHISTPKNMATHE